MTETTIRANETTVPVLPCADVEETLAFYQALGFEVTYQQTRPYLYLALEWSGFAVHFGKPPQGHDPAREDGGGCLVMVDEAAPYHAALTRAMRAAYGKVLAKGLPRLTRFRPGQSRFTLVDPSGNSLIFIQRDEPDELEYGGSKKLTGLARALDNARIFREFKNDDRAAFRALSSALRRHGDTAPALDRALALAALIELATALNEPENIGTWARELERIHLTDAERRRVTEELSQAEDLTRWLAGHAPEAGTRDDSGGDRRPGRIP
ncbi:VOC family protein [Streptomyces litchfieldiae]|uniref:Glyoxalase n=1 Tax=Streptomyces litchfieldiae TaxID=3075543 RepID=A0ABU2MN28_9ACTN|nr:glyoxalase [Streptomyces sp. DSM 44938]MDT0342856.1 glyoxalase [Streptomyces sp. DSM 44938]